MFRLRTVDVWDTLLRRRCHPEAIKLAVAQHIHLCFADSLWPGISDHWAIYNERLAIERDLAKSAEAAGHDGEYRIEDVFRRLLASVMPGLDQQALEAEARRLADYELELEIRNTTPDEDIWTAMEAYPADRTIYLSDFYMGADRLERLLEHHGILQRLDGGIASCDVMLTKRSGRLFNHVHKQFQVSADAHVHFGDNFYADVETPRRLGITAIEYLPNQAHAARQAREHLFATRDNLFRHVWDLSRTAPEQDAAFQVGRQAAPLFIAFAMFIAERALADRVDRLFFFTREGEFFHRVYESLFPDRIYAGHSLPPDSVLGVSRLSTFRASLEVTDEEDYGRLWALEARKSLSNILQILGLDLAEVAPHLKRYGLDPDTLVGAPAKDPAMRALLFDPAIQAMLDTSVTSQRVLMHDYLAEMGVVAGERLGCVDIGWRGTIQDNLTLFLEGHETRGYYMALRSFLNVQPEGATKAAFGADERKAFDAAVFSGVEPLELVCNSPEGSVLGYRRQDGNVRLIRDVRPSENAVYDTFTRQFQAGVVAASKVAQPILALHAVLSAELRPTAMKIWHELIVRPPEQLVKGYATTVQHDVFGIGGMFDRSSAPGLRALIGAVFSGRKRAEVIRYLRRTQWVQGVDGLNLGYVDRMALKAAYRVAHMVKNAQVHYDRNLRKS